MRYCNIYLSGKMSGCSLEEQLKWRNQIINAIKYGDYDYDKTVNFFNPPLYYSPSMNEHLTESEVFNFDLYNLRKSDIVVANLDNVDSVGTIMEIAIAKELKIPVIAFCKDLKTLHPWLIECCTRICYDIRETVEHIVKFYLS